MYKCIYVNVSAKVVRIFYKLKHYINCLNEVIFVR